MLYDALCNWVDSADYPTTIATGAIEEGVGLIHVIENGIGKVAISAGSSNNDAFAGIAISRRVQPTTAIKVETVVTSATTTSGCYTCSLSRVPVNPTTDVFIQSSTGSSNVGTIAITSEGSAGAVTTDTEYYLPAAGTLLYLNASNGSASTTWGPSVSVNLVYRYNLYVLEAEQLAGQQVPISATQQLNNVGVVQQGYIYTDKFQPADNWASWTASASTTIKCGANGIFTIASITGATVKASVVNVPTAQIPYLGLHIATY